MGCPARDADRRQHGRGRRQRRASMQRLVTGATVNMAARLEQAALRVRDPAGRVDLRPGPRRGRGRRGRRAHAEGDRRPGQRLPAPSVDGPRRDRAPARCAARRAAPGAGASCRRRSTRRPRVRSQPTAHRSSVPPGSASRGCWTSSSPRPATAPSFAAGASPTGRASRSGRSSRRSVRPQRSTTGCRSRSRGRASCEPLRRLATDIAERLAPLLGLSDAAFPSRRRSGPFAASIETLAETAPGGPAVRG